MENNFQLSGKHKGLGDNLMSLLIKMFSSNQHCLHEFLYTKLIAFIKTHNLVAHDNINVLWKR